MTRLPLARPALLWLLCAPLLAAEEAALWHPWYVFPRAGERHIDLSADWQLTARDAQAASPRGLDDPGEWLPVTAPTSVHAALHRAGRLPAPYVGLNAARYAGLDRKVWYYRKTFTAPALNGAAAYLCFDGLDYYSRIWLNGNLLGRHEGMLAGPQIDVTGSLRAGANELAVEVRAGNWGLPEGHNYRGAPGRVIRPWMFAAGESSAGSFHTVGMWRGARIEIAPAIHLDRPFLVTESATAAEARLRLSVEVLAGTVSGRGALHHRGGSRITEYLDAFAARPAASRSLRVTLTHRGRAALTRTVALKLIEGRNWVDVPLALRSPALWWPNGMGEPNLYGVRLELLDGGAVSDRIEFRSAIRTVRTLRGAGPQTQDRWNNWQWTVNGRRLFLKGVNWMPADLLLDLPKERYEWLLGTAKAAGIQLVRVWGGGLVETEDFYDVCDRLGLMVWQEFPLSNIVVPEWPQDIWEAQVIQNIFRLRNRASLAVWCAGNESNPYAEGNAAAMGVFERSVRNFDPTRPYFLTSPDGGSAHVYHEMEPTWYAKIFAKLPFMAETGVHSMPEAATLREIVAAKELETPLAPDRDPNFIGARPELAAHLAQASQPRYWRPMFHRATHYARPERAGIETLALSTQLAAAEYYQILSEQLQANFPVTTGLMPWVLNRPWPMISIMLIDGLGQPTASWYAIKRTYEPTHIALALPELHWGPGETVPLTVKVTHAPGAALPGLTATVTAFGPDLARVLTRTQRIDVRAGPSVAAADLGGLALPASGEDGFYLLTAELKDSSARTVSRSFYWVRYLRRMGEPAFRDAYRARPQSTFALPEGPSVKEAIEGRATTLTAALTPLSPSRFRLTIRNTGKFPAFPVSIDLAEVRRLFRADDNYFVLPPSAVREIEVEALWREPRPAAPVKVTVAAWNAAPRALFLDK